MNSGFFLAVFAEKLRHSWCIIRAVLMCVQTGSGLGLPVESEPVLVDAEGDSDSGREGTAGSAAEGLQRKTASFDQLYV